MEHFTVDERAEYERNFSMEKALDDFMKKIDTDREQVIPTGFAELDAKLDGGLHADFYVLGAEAAIGKTALILQLANNIAKQDIDVLYFLLDMPGKELMARSLSYESYCYDSQHALSTRQVLKHETNSKEEERALEEALARYRQYAKHLYVLADTKAEDIRKAIEAYRAITNNRKCVVVVDYLQILEPANNELTDKQAVDKNVAALKRISREFNICVFALSSFNRDSYDSVADFSSFKESGSVEYSCDCLLAMQYAGFDYQYNESNKERLERIRKIRKDNAQKKAIGDYLEIQLRILKNRHGIVCNDIHLMFNSRYNYFCNKELWYKKLVEDSEKAREEARMARHSKRVSKKSVSKKQEDK